MPFIKCPEELKDCQSNYHLYVIAVPKRDKLLKFLKLKGVNAGIHYPLPCHLQKPYKKLGYKKGDFPIAEKLSETVLSLPMHTELTEDQLIYIVDSIKEFFL